MELQHQFPVPIIHIMPCKGCKSTCRGMYVRKYCGPGGKMGEIYIVHKKGPYGIAVSISCPNNAYNVV